MTFSIVPRRTGRLQVGGWIVGGERQSNGEFTALADAGARGLYGAAVHFRRRLHQGQPNAQPGRRTVPGSVHLREHVEDMSQLIARYANSRIAHRNGDVGRAPDGP